MVLDIGLGMELSKADTTQPSRIGLGVLHESIHVSQGAFVQGRQILDAVLIANDIVMRKDAPKMRGHISELKINLDKGTLSSINMGQDQITTLALLLECKVFD
ncbi:hypothetical protein CK203_043574 [Vitis vinifera]|uniref:Uncharacterized protein n=1 Tax=Vitis vinifera TaxID=29760 RepID=A0A438HYI9_VITVI|nr:hypothetical protein CK203_043574 [Vitis vinifera]